MIYFDNAATSFPKPPSVVAEMTRCINEYCANPGRGSHSLAVETSMEVFKARQLLCDFFGIQNPMRLVFTKNATEALNIGILGIAQMGDHIITTSMEHNSVVRPLKHLERDNIIELSIAECDEDGNLAPEQIRKLLKVNTKMLVMTMSSNVTGIVMPYKEIAKICKENNIIFMLDASQGAGVLPINVELDNIDVLAFPGHKGLMGPQGTGGLYIKEGINIKPLYVGGTGSHSESIYQITDFPDMLESGTLNVPGIVGLMAGVDFINNVGINNINLHKSSLVKLFVEKLKDMNEYNLFSPIENNSGIVAISRKDIESTEISYVLDKVYDIKTRAGLQCSPFSHKTIRSYEEGLVRLSFGWFNTKDEVIKSVEALNEIENYIKESEQ